MLKKSNISFTLILAYWIFQILITNYLPNAKISLNSSVGLMVSIFIYLGIFLLAMYFKLEESDISTKEIGLIAIYSAFSAVSRIPFIAIPSVQPCSYLIFCAGYVFGPLIGFVVGANTALLSNFIVGQGPWTFYQMFGWGLIGMSGSIFRFFIKKEHRDAPNKYVLGIIGFVLGFFYGWILNLWYLIILTPSFETWILANINSFPFDIGHAIGNLIFMIFFGQTTIKILTRFRRRFFVKQPQSVQEIENPELSP